MLVFRWLLLMLLLAAFVAYALHLLTGQAQYKTFADRALKWAVLAGLGFFTVLILERVA